MLSLGALAQRIVVDSSSTSKYLIKKPESTLAAEEAPASPSSESTDDLSFGERALSIGKGIVNRLKARLNLEEAAESIKGKKDKLLGGKGEEENQDNKEEGG